MNPTTPDKVVEDLLVAFFGKPSLVVSTFLILNAIWAWWSFAHDAVSLGRVIVDDVAPHATAARWLKVSASIRLATAWVLLYVPASFATQLWAGSQYSPGQGGGIGELLLWSMTFGLIATAACFLLCPAAPPRFGDKRWAPLAGLFVGYALGVAWAVVGYSLRGGPKPGDWWVAPAMSLVGVLGSTIRMRIASVKSWQL